jgi:flagella synthesis protein FlgN
VTRLHPPTPAAAPGRRAALVQALSRLAHGVQADLATYASLEALLEAQLEAARGHRAARLAALADEILSHVDTLDGTRRERVALAAEICGPAATKRLGMDDVLACAPAPARALMQADWSALEARVRHCKQLNARNGRFLADQHDIMQRVIGQEVHTYAAG